MGCVSTLDSGNKLETGHTGGLFPRFQVCPDWNLETKGYGAQRVSFCFHVSSGKAAETMIDLQAIFGDGPAPVAAPEVIPEAVAPVAAPGPDDDGGRQHDDDGGRFAGWVRRPDAHGRMGWEAPDLPEAVPLDALPLPGPACPRCGSLEQWQDALGRQRCGRCEADALGKAMKLAERAARLRNRRSCQNENP
jgi:ribosomal protein S27AE